MRKLIVFVFIAVFATACGGGEAMKYSGYKGSYPESQYITAEGLGDSEPEAKQRALGELAGIFEAKVRSDATDRMRSSIDASGVEAFEQSIDSAVRVLSEVELKGAEVVETRYEGSTYYALAVLSRKVARDNWLSEIRVYEEKIDGELAAASSAAGRLEQYASYRQVALLWAEREIIASRLKVIGYDAASIMPDPVKHAFNSISELRASMPVYFNVRTDSVYFIDRMKEAVGAAGFRVTESMESAYIVVDGEVKVEPVEIAHPEWKYARAVVTLSVRDAKTGNAIAEVTDSVRATHLMFSEAADRAIKKSAPVAAEALLRALNP